MKLDLPEDVLIVAEARNKLRARFSNHKLKNGENLRFTPDGKFVGDLGEAIAAEHFNLELEPGPHIDGFTRCDRRIPVQIKATGRMKSGAFQFRKSNYVDHARVYLIAIQIDWDDHKFEIVYAGPEWKVRPSWRDGEHRAKDVSVATMRRNERGLEEGERLVPFHPVANSETP